MKNGVPPTYRSPCGDCLTASPRPSSRVGTSAFRAGPLLLGSLLTLIFASSALGAGGSVRSGSQALRDGSASPATKGRHDPNQAGGADGCADMCGGCMGGGGESSPKTPVVAAETPVVTKPPVVVAIPTSGLTETATGAVGAARAAAVASVPGTVVITVRPSTRSTTKADKPTRRTVKRRADKHHPKARHGASERSLARPVLPGERPAFTG